MQKKDNIKCKPPTDYGEIACRNRYSKGLKLKKHAGGEDRAPAGGVCIMRVYLNGSPGGFTAAGVGHKSDGGSVAADRRRSVAPTPATDWTGGKINTH